MGKDNGKSAGNLICSFCGKTQEEVRKLVAGPSVYICDECVELCNDILTEEFDGVPHQTTRQAVPTPKDIKASLDDYII